jgi:SNF2 family DNA or RNA helicase
MPSPGQHPSSGIRDNRARGAVGDYLKAKIKPAADLSVVSAYFTIFAYDALRSQLESAAKLRFLFGEPRFISSLDPTKTDKKAFQIEDTGLVLANRLQQKAVARECADWIQRKVDIRSIAQANLLHGKLYHIDNQGVSEAILGSSNFTVSGLGLGHTPNIELNLEVDSRRDREDLKAWFDELWQDSTITTDVKAEVLAYLEQLYENHAPQFIYFKTLYHVFEDLLRDRVIGDEQLHRTSLLETKIWKSLYTFQRDGVKSAINKILTFNGCILADSVGLGKTYEALAVIKYFELKNERVLVLCPKKLRENWTVYRNNDLLNPFDGDRFRFDVLSHTDLSRDDGLSGDIDLSTINWGNYDLVVIDESHNFRNNSPGRKNEDGTIIRRSRYARLMEDIVQQGVKSKILLLSATPVNNTLRDLRNQLYLISEGSDNAFSASLGVDSLESTLKVAQGQFSNWAKKPSHQRKTSDLLANLSSAFFKLLDQLTIARSRKHIQRYYKESIAELGGFPERLKPLSRSTEIDLSGRFMSYDRLNEEIDRYELSLYKPSLFLKPEHKPHYEALGRRGAFTQEGREKFLIGMMKVGLLKRLESSVHSFASTMDRAITKIDVLEKRILDFQAKAAGNSTYEPDELPIGDDDDAESIDAQQVGGRLKYDLAHLDIEKWLKALKRDRQQLGLLAAQAASVTVERDAKLQELKNLIRQKVLHPTTNKEGGANRKVLVFTAYSDTAIYLYDALQTFARKDLGIHLAVVTGGAGNRTTFGDADFNRILTNFSPRAKRRSQQPSLPQDETIDLLIATDCISEGQNLQDCDYLVNYDIHWNPVRIIQRFGRIDRIGSINPAVQLVNFWPTDDLNRYINLKHRVEARMALVDLSATFEDNPLANQDLEELIASDLKYRDKQLLRMKQEVLDLEDLQDDGVSLTEFTLDDFRAELSRYLQSHEQLLRDAPFGLYAVVPADPKVPNAQPGVIYCLRQRTGGEATTTVNPLSPYFLVYVHADGTTRYTFAQPKQILELFRSLATERTEPVRALCDLFDAETKHGHDMAAYSTLLDQAMASIAATFKKRAASALLQGRGGLLIPEAAQVKSDPTAFELITWLVIK